MKNVSLFVLSICTLLAFNSCKKSTVIVDPAQYQPRLVASIYPQINQPTNATLGESTAVFATGDEIIIYAPYEISNDQITLADLVVTNDQNQVVAKYQLSEVTETDAVNLIIPEELKSRNFLVASILVEDHLLIRRLICQ